MSYFQFPSILIRIRCIYAIIPGLLQFSCVTASLDAHSSESCMQQANNMERELINNKLIMAMSQATLRLKAMKKFGVW